MPNHIHVLVFTKNTEERINNVIGTTKRFMAYEIIRRLKNIGRNDLLKRMHDSVNPNEKQKNKIHNAFQPLLDIKKIVSERFIDKS